MVVFQIQVPVLFDIEVASISFRIHFALKKKKDCGYIWKPDVQEAHFQIPFKRQNYI